MVRLTVEKNGLTVDDRGWRDPRHVADYLAREIPHRQKGERLLLEALPASVERVIDLGTGDGRLIALVRARHPRARAIGLDFSQPMLDRAALRFAGDELVELRRHDLAKPLPADLAVCQGERVEDGRGRAQAEAVVSALAIHHLEDERKRSLFAEVHSLLAPGGVFANLDLVASPTAEQHERFRRAIGRQKDDPADRLAGLSVQLDWLRDAGFEEVGCRFKWLELALLLARRRG